MRCSDEVLLTATGCARPDMDKLNWNEMYDMVITSRLNLAVLHGDLYDTIWGGVSVLSGHDHVKIAFLELCNKRPLLTSFNKHR